MEQTRMFVVQSVQRARLVQFDGQPVAPWTTGQGQSLPPPVDTPARGRRDRKPKADPVETARLYEAVRQMLAQGRSSKTVAKALGLDIKRVYAMKHRLVHGLVVAVVEAQQATPETAPRTPAPPVCLAPSPEPVRTYVLDWAARLDRMEFDGEPGKGKPKRAKSRSKCSRADFRSVYPCPYVSAPARINPVHATNCAAPARFAGEGVLNIEQQWRTACTA